jgi:two-component system NtrC family sensor kinase
VRQTLETGQTTQRNERRYVGDDVFEWEINTYPIRDDNDRIIQAVLMEQDVTERRRLEAILTQSEKLAAIGQLAAGVAHEINNPLTAIIANAQILHRELPPNSDLQESVDLIARAGARATQVVRNLLDFARKEEYHLGVTDPNETIERALELIQHEILSRGIRLEFNPDPNLPPILASQDHLQSVWLNLLLNAIDSLDKTPAEVHITTLRIGNEIHVKVSDNGKGIPSDRLTRIFEPFYTTKAAGRGTGLGLSVSHRIVRQHGGRIGVESQVGVGSTFTVVLPTS